MATQVLQFIGLNERGRRKVQRLPSAGKGDIVEVRVLHANGDQDATPLPREAANLIGIVLEHLRQGQRVAVLAEDQEVSPNDAASILGISRPLVVHRMEIGDLAFRYVGKHRRARLGDVLMLKRRLDEQQAVLGALADETEALMRDHGL